MATPNDVRIQAQTMSGLTIDQAVALKWIQEEIQTIAYRHSDACTRIAEHISVPAGGTVYELTARIVQVRDVVDANNRRITDYEIATGSNKDYITLANEGRYLLTYYALPSTPTTADTEINLPIPYVEALKYHVASRTRARYMGQSDTNAVSFAQQCTDALKEADMVMARMNRRHRRMPPGRRSL